MMNANKAREVYKAYYENIRKMNEENAKNFCENVLNDRIIHASRDGQLSISVELAEIEKAGVLVGTVIGYLKANEYDARVNGIFLKINW